MSTYRAALLNVGTLNATGTSAQVQANTATVTNLNATNVSATNMGLTNSLSLTGNLSVRGTMSDNTTNSIVVECPYNPKTRFNSTAAGANPYTQIYNDPANPLVQRYQGQGAYIGKINSLVNVEYFNDIRYGCAPVGPLRLMPCVPYYLNPLGNIVTGAGFSYTASTGPHQRDWGYNTFKTNVNALDAYVEPSNINQVGPYSAGVPPAQISINPAKYQNPDELSYLYNNTSEDCLMLDVYRPIGTKGDDANQSGGDKLPVIFWIHGGSFIHFNRRNHSYLTQLVKENKCIMVMPDYRKSVLGMFPDEQFRCPNYPAKENGYQLGGGHFAGVCGNQNITDLVVALQWVQTNIGYFGGDAANVTIMGQSAGGAFVELLRGSPLVRDASGNNELFQRGLGISGNFNASTGSSVSLFGNILPGILFTPSQHGQTVTTYNLGSISTNKMTQQQQWYSTFMYGAPLTVGTGANAFSYYTFKDASKNTHVCDSSNSWGPDGSGIYHDAVNYVDASGFKKYIEDMSTTKAKSIPINDSALGPAASFNGSTPYYADIRTAVRANLGIDSGGIDTSTGLAYRNGTTNIMGQVFVNDGKSLNISDISNLFGRNPEVDNSGNKIPDIDVYYTNTGSEDEYYDQNSAGYVGPTSGPLLPNLFPATATRYPNNVSAFQFSKGKTYRKHYAALASQFYKVPGQTRKNISSTWTNIFEKVTDPSNGGIVTEIYDIFDAWHAPELTVNMNSAGTQIAVDGSGVILGILVPGTTNGFNSYHRGLGYTQTDASNGIPIQFYYANPPNSSLTTTYPPYGTLDTSSSGFVTFSRYTTDASATTLSNWGWDASGNQVVPVDNSGNAITDSFYVSGVTMTSRGTYPPGTRLYAVIRDPSGAMPVYGPYFKLFNYLSGDNQQTMSVRMATDLWAYGSVNGALRSCDGPKKAYYGNMNHYFKGKGTVPNTSYQRGAYHGVDLQLYGKCFDYEPGTWHRQIMTSLALSSGRYGERQGDPYNYTPTPADYTVSQAMRDALFNFAKTGVPTFKDRQGNLTQIPSLADSSGLCYIFNSDDSGNDISTVTPIGSVQSGFMDFYIKLVYGMTPQELAVASKAATPGYYTYPAANPLPNYT